MRFFLASPGESPAVPSPWAADGNPNRREPPLIPELAQIADAWPLGASLAALAARGLHAGRRRSALNEALHELRRPLQVLALATPASGAVQGPALDGAVRMAATALERLEQEINGSPVAPQRAMVPAHTLTQDAVERWRARAALAGRQLSLRWRAGAAKVAGDRDELAAALDNLIDNALAHGGGEIVVEGRRELSGLQLVVADGGAGSLHAQRTRRIRRAQPGDAGELLARLNGRHRHGHGLRVVRRVAAAHGGDFRLYRRERGTEAVVELPVATEAGG